MPNTTGLQLELDALEGGRTSCIPHAATSRGLEAVLGISTRQIGRGLVQRLQQRGEPVIDRRHISIQNGQTDNDVIAVVALGTHVAATLMACHPGCVNTNAFLQVSK